MKLQTKTIKTQGFTLIEMIGVLAVIAILAALLIPKVFQAITEAKINTVPVGVSTCKTAVIDHYAKYGVLNSIKGAAAFTVPATGTPGGYLNYDDTVLLAEGFIDKPFAPRIGDSADIVLRSCRTTTTTPTADDTGYALSGGTANEVLGSHVIEAVITGVTKADAQAISMRIDGADMSEQESAVSATSTDLKGRVKYGAGSGGTTTVYIYLTHR